MYDISTKPGRYVIEREEQLELLASSVRQEILDSLAARGPSSMTELSRMLGVPADTLYYHMKKLLDAGLTTVHSERQTGRRPEVVYTLPGRGMTLGYDPDDPVRTQLVNNVVAAAMRTAIDDFSKAAQSGDVRTEGPLRDLWGARFKAWLDEDELREVNRLLVRLQEIFEASAQTPGGELCTLAWVVAPVPARSSRRSDEQS